MSLSLALLGVPFAAAGLGYAVSKARRRRATPNAETLMGDYVPWSHVADDGRTVHTVEGGLFRVYRLDGCIYDGRATGDIEQIETRRAAFFFSLRDNPVQMRLVSDRRHFALPPPNALPGVLRELDTLWHSRFENAYVTSHHVIISTPNDGGQAQLDDACQSLETLFRDYNPRPLEIGSEDYSPLLSFLARHLNRFEVTSGAISHALGDRLSFVHVDTTASGAITYSDGQTTIHGGIMSLKLWPDKTTPRIVNRLLTVPVDFSLVLNLWPYTKDAATPVIAHREKQAKLAWPNEIVAAQWAETKKEHEADLISMIDAEITVFVHGRTESEQQIATDKIRSSLGGNAIRMVKDRLLADRLFWSRLPGYDYKTRPWFLNNKQIGDLTPLPDNPKGLDRSYWGASPIRYYSTTTGAPYGYTYHVSADEQAAGHFLVFAPTSKGKSTKTGFDICGALSAHPDLRAYLFDRNLGLRVLVQALDGDYLIPEGAGLPLNPFHCEPTEENFAFLERFVALLAGTSDDDDQAINDIATTVRDIMDLPNLAQRSLRAQWDKATPADSALRPALKKWAGRDRYGRIFNGDRDALDLEGPRVVAFDMTAAGDEPRINAALTYYFMRRIRASLKARAQATRESTPHVIFIDEAAPSFLDPVFAREAEVLFREHRKLDGVVGAAFQEIRAMRKTPVATTIRANTSTWLFWPGTAQDAEDLDVFPFTPDERQFVLTGKSEAVTHMSRPVLLKREQESVFLETDLSAIGPYIRIFRGGEKPVARMQDLINKHGPTQWLSHYLIGE